MTQKNNVSLIDSHCHLNLLVKKEFNDLPLTKEQITAAREYIDQAAQVGVHTIINVGTNISENLNCITLAHEYQSVYAVVGIYPTDLTDNWHDDIKILEKMLREKEKNKIVGVGEIGIDLYRAGYNLTRQIDGFRAQIELALKYDVAIVIHTRAAAPETLKILQEFKGQITRGVIHCFSYDWSIAQEIYALSLCISISGVVLNPNNTSLHTVVQRTELEHLLIETDAPFLAKHFPDHQSTPAHIVFVAQEVARLKNTRYTDVARATSTNTKRIFGLMT